MEIITLEAELLEHFIKGSFLVTKALKIGEGDMDTDIHSIISDIIIAHYSTFLPAFNIERQAFYDKYKAVLNVDTFPVASAPPSQQPVLSPHFAIGGRFLTQESTLTESTANIKRTLECIFLTSSEHYKEQVKKNTININLKKLDINHLVEDATADADMEVTNEPSVNPEMLQELIRKEAKKLNSKLENEVKSLKKEISTVKSLKNGNGARTPTRGASTKKKQSNSTPKKVRFAAAGQKAADAAKDTKRNSKGQKPRNTPKKQRGTRKPSSTARRK